jgi:transposase
LNKVPKGIKLEDIDIWFQDEARVGQKGTLTRTWALKGTRPRLKRQQQYEYAYVFGAVCPKRDEAVGVVMPAVNSNAMKVHLELISAKVAEGRHAVIIMDQAKWHTTNKVRLFPNITLFFLPPASPELNPTEQVWRQLREDAWANRSFENYEAIVEACCSAWNRFTDHPGAVKKLCTRAWANL